MTFKKISCLALSALLLLTGCSSSNSDGYKAGTYTGTAKGYVGDLTVEVVLSTEKIESVSVTNHSETESVGTIAIDTLPEVITSTQAVDFDVVSGATFTSEAIRVAVTAALKEAGIDASTLVAVGGDDDQNAEDVIMDADVVVIGAGGAGMSAAIEAADAGKKVVIIETAAMAGGNTTRATGGMNAGNTPVQDTNEFAQTAGVEKTLEAAKAFDSLTELAATVSQQYADYQATPEGYFDTVELFMLDTLVGGKNLNNVELVNTLATNSADGIEWLKSVGVDLSAVGSFGGASVMRIHKPVNAEGKTIAVGSYMIPLLETACTDRDVEILYNAHASEITVDENGAVTGVVAEGYTVNTTAVIVATGGFGANPEMLAQYSNGQFDNIENMSSTNDLSIQGDGINMATKIGAQVVAMGSMQVLPIADPENGDTKTIGGSSTGLYVNKEGLRFVDESENRNNMVAAISKQTDSQYYVISSEENNGIDADGYNMMGLSLENLLESGKVIKADTIAELAEKISIDPVTLQTTIDKFNIAATTKVDAEFGRIIYNPDFVNEGASLVIGEGPYYACLRSPAVHITKGGILIDESSRVLDENNEQISGLYAAGETTGGMYMKGLGNSIYTGRIAGETIIADFK